MGLLELGVSFQDGGGVGVVKLRRFGTGGEVGSHEVIERESMWGRLSCTVKGRGKEDGRKDGKETYSACCASLLESPRATYRSREARHGI